MCFKGLLFQESFVSRFLEIERIDRVPPYLDVEKIQKRGIKTIHFCVQ